ncbi:MAG TPA: alpha/beta hydrolase [Chloroflexota bacterium]|jgi:pimeloyl-ACP methyl ester carboxylesterase
MAIFERDGVALYYEEHGSGFPLLLIAPGGMNSTVDFWARMPINPVELFPSEFHVIAMDQRNAGRSSGPLPLDDPWGAHVGDQLALMDHLGIERFLAVGCCIGCSYILKIVEVAPSRLIAGVMMQPIGKDETNPGVFGERIYKQWCEDLAAKRTDISPADITTFGHRMWEDHEFIISVPREFLPTVRTPLLVLPGNDPAHPIGVGREVARLLPNSEIFDKAWREPDIVPETVERMRSFLHAHTPSLETA